MNVDHKQEVGSLSQEESVHRKLAMARLNDLLVLEIKLRQESRVVEVKEGDGNSSLFQNLPILGNARLLIQN